MSPSSILNIFVLLSLADLGWSSVLLALNYREAWLRRGQVPPELGGEADAPDSAAAAKATDYSRAKMRFSFVQSIIGTFAVLILAVSGAFGALDSLLAARIDQEYWLGAAFLGSLLLARSLLGAPFSLYLSFRIEKRFGFNAMTARTWLLDAVKGLLLNAALGLPLLFLLYAFMNGAGRLWWLVAAGIFALIDVALSIVYPLLIAPLFNKFTPLPEGELKEKIGELAGRLSFRLSGVYVMDGSKRSRHSNAYFTGMGRSKRIVLYDTLIGQLGEDEILAVLAHEIGHEKGRHTLKLTAIAIAASFLGFWTLELCSGWRELYAAFGFAAASKHALILLVSLVSGPATFFLVPAFSALSRKFEYEADAFAARAAGAGAMAAALKKLDRENASNLWPHPLYAAWHYSHPTLRARLAAIGGIGAEGKPRS